MIAPAAGTGFAGRGSSNSAGQMVRVTVRVSTIGAGWAARGVAQAVSVADKQAASITRGGGNGSRGTGFPFSGGSGASFRASDRSDRALLGPGFPIIGVGGILCARDAVEKIKAGADVVQIYTGLIYRGPSLVLQVARALRRA